MDEQHIRVERHPREHPPEGVGQRPVCGGRPSVQEPGGGEGEGAGADGDDTGTGRDAGEGGSHGRRALVPDPAERVRRDDDRARGLQDLGAVFDGDAEVGVGTHRLTVGRAGEDFVASVGRAEHPLGDAQFEGIDTLQGEDGDPVGVAAGRQVR